MSLPARPWSRSANRFSNGRRWARFSRLPPPVPLHPPGISRPFGAKPAKIRRPRLPVPSGRPGSENPAKLAPASGNRPSFTVTREENVKKSDLAARVAGKLSISESTADASVSALFEAIGDALSKGESVSIPGFGIFSVKDRAARQGRNPGPARPSPLPRRRCRRSRPGRGSGTPWASSNTATKKPPHRTRLISGAPFLAHPTVSCWTAVRRPRMLKMVRMRWMTRAGW